MRRACPDRLPSCSSGGLVGHAQVVVYDAAVTFRNSVTAVLKEYLLTVQRAAAQPAAADGAATQHVHGPGASTALPDAPRWRTHDFENHEAVPVFARPTTPPSTTATRSGDAFRGVSQPVLDAAAALGRLAGRGPARPAVHSWRPLTSRTPRPSRHARHRPVCATTVAENWRAIDALDGDVTDGSLEQSTTAVLDKISGAVLIGARQRQARVAAA